MHFEYNTRAHMGTALFLGLSACASLARLKVRGFKRQRPKWYVGADVAAHPQLLRLWLPNVTQLVCSPDMGLLPLVKGLGPGLSLLDVSNGVPYDRMFCAWLAEALPACRQLQHVMVAGMTQPILDALVLLPALTNVEVSGDVLELQHGHATSCSAWQELDLLSAMVLHEAQQVAKFPLKSVQQLVLGPLYMELPSSADQRQATRAVSRVPDWQWSCEIDAYYRTDAEQFEAADEWGHGEQSLLHLHTLIADLAPLTRNTSSCQSLKLSWQLPRDTELSNHTAAAFGAALRPTITSLDLWGVCGCSVAPSFWAAIPRQLPQLRQILISGWHPRADSTAVAALAQFAAADQGPPLSIKLKEWEPDAATDALQAALSPPDAAGQGHARCRWCFSKSQLQVLCSPEMRCRCDKVVSTLR